MLGLLAAAALLFSAPASPALAADAAPDAAAFSKSCAACHSGGGNVVNGAQTLRAGDLRRAGLLSSDPDADTAALAGVIERGRGTMYGFGDTCAPRGACTFGPRLDAATVAALASFVRQQALAGWPL